MSKLSLKIITVLILFCSCKNNNAKSQPQVIDCDTLANFVQSAIGKNFTDVDHICEYDSNTNVYTVQFSANPTGQHFIYYGKYKCNLFTLDISKEIILNDSVGTVLDSNIVYNKQKHHL